MVLPTPMASVRVLQAVYEGIRFSQHVHLERIVKLSGRDKTLRLTGGPTRSKPWMQMVADISEMPVEVMHVEQSGCLGAAIAAAVGTGAHKGFKEAMAAMPIGGDGRAGYQELPCLSREQAAFRRWPNAARPAGRKLTCHQDLENDVTREALPNPLGICEKALPKDSDWPARLALAKALDFDFVEMSIDETDERLTRLSWSKAERAVLRCGARPRCFGAEHVPVCSPSLSVYSVATLRRASRRATSCAGQLISASTSASA